MKTFFRILAVLAVALAVLGPQAPTRALQPASAVGANVGRWGEWWAAIGKWSSLDQTGCIRTDTDVRLEFLYVTVLLRKYDVCNNKVLLRAVEDDPLEPGEFEVAPAQTSAHLKKTLHVEDSYDYSADIELDLVWTPTVALNTSSLNEIEHRDGCRYITRRREGWHHSDVSGTVTDGVTNFIPEPSTYGEFYWTKYWYAVGCQPQEMELFRQALSAPAGEQVNYRASDVQGSFSQLDSSGCIETGLFMYAGEGKLPGADPVRGLTIFAGRTDRCNNQSIFWAQADVPLTAAEFGISGNVATLKKTVTIDDQDRGISFDVVLDLIIKANGPADDWYTGTFKRRGPDCKTHTTETWGFRSVVPVGTAAVDGTQLDWNYGWLGWERLVREQCS